MARPDAQAFPLPMTHQAVMRTQNYQAPRIDKKVQDLLSQENRAQMPEVRDGEGKELQ